MMEGYFVRTLGMHRVYNSAFMNMLKREENAKYRETIRNTQEFDKDILKRFVNFMNNPDEETAVAQFGKGDKYFGVCTMMATHARACPCSATASSRASRRSTGWNTAEPTATRSPDRRPHRAPRARDIPPAQEAPALLRESSASSSTTSSARRLGERERLRLLERRRR